MSIRPIESGDLPRLLEIASQIGFEDEELTFLAEQLQACTSGALGEHHRGFTIDEGEGPVAIAYGSAEMMTNATWNLLLLAVRPDLQRTGSGTRLLAHVEATLAEAGFRLLIIDTSSLDDFAPARSFYARNGYQQVASVPDYYDDGDGRVTFSKRLREPKA